MVNGKRQPQSDSHVERSTNSSKRLRVSRACDQCRACREKCDGELRCSTCRSQDRACTYNSQPKKRGIQPNYLRTLELMLAWICQTSPTIESEITTALPQDQHRLSHLLHGREFESSEGLHATWRSSLIYKQIEQLLSGSSVDTNGYRIADYEGEEAGDLENRHAMAAAEPSLQREHSITQPRTSHIDLLTAMPSVSSDFQSPRQQSAQERHVPSEVLNLPGNALILVEYYFAFTHSWLPMTEKHSIMKVLYSYPSAGLPRDQLVAPEHAELWSIMALAAAQVNREDRPEFYHVRETAEALLPRLYANDSYHVPHLRTMINLALIDAGAEHLLAAWLRIEMVVSLLLFFRSHSALDMTDQRFGHLYLATFIVEKAIALRLGVLSHLPIQYVQDVGYAHEDGIEEWTPWIDPLGGTHSDSQMRGPARAFSTFNKLARYTIQMSRANQTPLVDHGGTLFSLLKNACLEEGRVQPWTLVTEFVTQSQAQDLTMHGEDTSFIEYTPQLGESLGAGSEQQIGDQSGRHALKDFGNNLANTPVLPDPPIVNYNAAHADPLISSPVVQRDTDFDTASVENMDSDIFEQLALLERQDSTQHSQFYQNLGFAPDVTLAEFFGSDYQPSDPLLAYLNPTLYSINQVSGAANHDNSAG